MARGRFSYENQEMSGRRRQLKSNLARSEQWAEAILPADGDAGSVETSTNRRPLWIMAFIMLISLGVLSSRLAMLQLVHGKRNLELADSQRIRQSVIRAPRGVIYDRNKSILVRNESNYDITVIPQQLPRDEVERRGMYEKVSKATGIALEEIIETVESNCLDSKNKVMAQKKESDCFMSARPQLVASNLSREQALLFDQRLLDFPAFALDINPIRHYMDSGSLAQTLGYSGRISADELIQSPGYLPTDYIGKLGIEKQYEQILRGINGSQQTEVDVTGRPVKVLANRQAAPGNNLVLSIDMGLQSHMTAAIAQQLAAAEAKGIHAKQGAGVALDPTTGEVLALVSLPSYDNNLFAKGISQSDFSKLLSDPAQPLFNKPVDGAYPIGSIIKPLIGSAALQERVINSSTTVNDSGSLQLPNPYDPANPYIFRSYEKGGFGAIAIMDAIRLSSNVFFFTVGGGFGNIGGLGIDRLAKYYRAYGLGSKPGLDLPSQAAGLVPGPEWKKKVLNQDWYVGDTYNVSVGQGDLKASPLHMANAIAGVANNGIIYKPHLLTQILDGQNRVIKTIKPEIMRKVPVSSEVYKVMKSAMRQVVSTPNGTGCCLTEQELPGLVAGKTGTAETGGYTGSALPHAWFEAFAPYDDPKIVVVVLIQNSGEGAHFALPAVRQTLKYYFTEGAGRRYLKEPLPAG
jgi:penicillin-binding protein 2